MIISEAGLVVVIGHTAILLDGHGWFEVQWDWDLRRRRGEQP